MGLRDRFKEGIFRMRVVPKPTPADKTTFTNKENSLPEKLNNAVEFGQRIDLSDISKIGTLSGDRNTKYSVYEEMVADGRIGAALEMYANDTVQYNQEGKIVWAESNDKDTAAYVNKLLADLNIEEQIWSWAYCMWLYGDVYIETFVNTSYRDNKPTLLVEPVAGHTGVTSQVDIKGEKLERYIEKVPNPATIYDLQYKGKTSGFIKQDNLQKEVNNNIYTYSNAAIDVQILNPTKFVHICLSPNINRFPEKFKFIKNETNKQADKYGRIDASETEGSGNDSLTFGVKTGQSVLENVYGAYQTLKLKEESVLLERVTKSSITRIIQVELGDLPESQKRNKLQALKNQIEQQLIMNKEQGNIQSRPGGQPIENIIYTTTKNGKGAISSVNIGGDVDIGNLGDIEDSENKVYGALLTPKAILGADMEGSGLSNGGSLTELNTTYARRIKRGQVALTAGIKTLVNIFALSDNNGKMVNNFDIKLTPLITVEDNRRDELLQTKIRNVSEIQALFESVGDERLTPETKLNMLIEWLGSYLNQQDIVNIIKKQLDDITKSESETETEANAEDMAKMVDDNPSVDIDIHNSPSRPSSFTPSTETEEVPAMPRNLETAEEVDLSEIEGQDLV